MATTANLRSEENHTIHGNIQVSHETEVSGEAKEFSEVSSDESLDLESKVKLPYTLKKKMLATPGTWNGFVFTSDSIKKAYEKTDWEDKEIRSLFTDHEDRKSKEWVGEVKNPFLENNTLYGDLVIVDKPTAIKLDYGAKFGISPSIDGDVDQSMIKEFTFNNFSVVINPAIKPAYINFAEKEPYGDVVYADPGYQEDNVKRYPIDTEEHVRAAWSYINMPKNAEKYSDEHLAIIKQKIQQAAEKFDIKISEEKMKEDETKKKDVIEEQSNTEVDSHPQEKLSSERTDEPKVAKEETVENQDGSGIMVDAVKALNEKFDMLVEVIKNLESKISEKPLENQSVEDEEKPKEEDKDMSEDSEKENKEEELVSMPKPDGTGPHGKGMGPGKGKADGTGMNDEEDEYYDDEEDKEKDKNFSQELFKRDKLITELSEKVNLLERQLRVPNKVVKKADFSNSEAPKDVAASFNSAVMKLRGM